MPIKSQIPLGYLVRSWSATGFDPASNQLRTSSEPASVMEFGFYCTTAFGIAVCKQCVFVYAEIVLGSPLTYLRLRIECTSIQFCLVVHRFAVFATLCCFIRFRKSSFDVSSTLLGQNKERKALIAVTCQFCCTGFGFLANVNSRSRSLYAIDRPSVCRLSSVVCLSVTFVRPTQAVQIFGNISTAVLFQNNFTLT